MCACWSRTHASSTRARTSPRDAVVRAADGGAFLQFLRRVADLDQVPAYLESAGGKNATIYSKAGFEVKESAIVKRWYEPTTYDIHGGIHAMVRPPQATP